MLLADHNSTRPSVFIAGHFAGGWASSGSADRLHPRPPTAQLLGVREVS